MTGSTGAAPATDEGVAGMPFDRLLEEFYKSLEPYQQSGDAAIVFSDSMTAGAQALWAAAQPVDAEHPTAEEVKRIGDAHHALGWLHFYRASEQKPPDNHHDLATAIVHFETMVDELSAIPAPLHDMLGSSASPDSQISIAHELLTDYMVAQDPACLDAVIILLSAAFPGLPDDHPNRATALSFLFAAYLARYQLRDTRIDLDKTLETGEQAIRATPADHSGRAFLLTTLSANYQVRFENFGSTGDLDRGVALAEEVVAGAGNDPKRAEYLSDLGNAYKSRFERLGSLVDLDRAIEAGVQAVAAATATHPDADKAVMLGNLSNAYFRRFESSGVRLDLDRAIETGAESVARTPDGDPGLARVLDILGNAYWAQFVRGGDGADLDRAVDAGERALAQLSQDDPRRPGILSNLGHSYKERYGYRRIAADLDRAIELGELAVGTASDRDPDRSRYLCNLGVAYWARFNLHGQADDVRRAIHFCEQDVASTPADHSTMGLSLYFLGAVYLARLSQQGEGIGGPELHALAGSVATATASPPVHRVMAGRSVGMLAHALGQHRLAVDLLDAAVGMLPSVAPREAGWADQEHRLAQHGGLVTEAIAAHCAIGDHAGAVAIAELGRGVLLAGQLDSRTSLTDLESAEPELAAAFLRIRTELNAPAVQRGDPAGSGAHHLSRQKALWAEYDRLLARIRQLPRFARFLLPPAIAELRAAATGGTVVLVNSGQTRGDAILVTADSAPVHIALPALDHDDVLRNVGTLLGVTHDQRVLVGPLRRQRDIPPVLGWLWDAIVKPVLDAVPPADGADPSRRIWWMPTGFLGLLPLHAAGHSGAPGALDLVLSSYTPTLRALAHSRGRPAATVRHQLTVAMRHTPGLPSLNGTVAEAAGLRAGHPDTAPLIDELATTGRVIAALPDATWVHFACHAGANLDAPSEGGLFLHDGTLRVATIAKVQLAQAELAYLSACSTAHSGIRNTDESINLASSFQLAGFRHVIASMWPLADSVAATAAQSFYRTLPDHPGADHAADTLRQVTLALRAEYPDRPDLWAPLIHTGP